ncbi:MAG: TolB family protein [Flavobacteriales bacterium]
MRIKLLLFIVFFAGSTSFAQYYIIGQNSSSTNWKQINTEHFQIIYPQDFEEKAQYTANWLNLVYDKATVSLKTQPKKISVILQNDMVESNGFVTLAPRRVELFTTPPQQDEGLEWLNLLAVHEFRHVVQISKYNQGLTKLLYFLFGEQGVGLVLGATTPTWFLEGDAVGFETFATGYGRGRLPSFTMESRAMLLQLGAFNYDKASMGSFKTFIPSRYPFGYHYTTYVKDKYGIKTWDSVMNRVASFPLIPFPFSSALRKYTGKGTGKMYKEMVKYSSEKWNRSIEINKALFTPFEVLNDTVHAAFTSYDFPVETSAGLLAVKSGMADVAQIVLLKEGKEKSLMKFGDYDKSSFSANQNYAVWAEQFPDLRWEYRSFSDIVLYDVQKEKRVRFTSKQRLFAPSISADNKIVAVGVDKGNVPSLQLFSLDSNSAYLKKEFKEMDMIYFPVFGDSNSIYFVAKKEGYQNIFKWNYVSDVVEPLVAAVPFVITNLTYFKGHLAFHSTQSGIDNIFELDLMSNEIHQLTVSKFGAFNPSFSADGKLLYNDYSATGMNAVKTDFKPSALNAKPFFVSQVLMYSNVLQDEQKVLLNKNNMEQFASEKYYTHLHLFNLHSWAPLSVNAESREANLGVSLMSQNKLSNTLTTYNYTLNPQQERTAHELKIDYNFWFPKFTLSATDIVIENISVENDTGYTNEQLRQQVLGIGSSVDLNLTRGYLQRYFGVGTRYSYNDITRTDDLRATLNAIDYNVYYYCGTRRSKRDLQALWAMTLNAFYHQSIFIDEYYSNSVYASLKVNTPGLLKHNALQIKAEWQQSNASGFQVSNSVDLPRGYVGVFYNTISSLKADYVFPVLYPDIRLGALLYLQRIRMGFHYDYAQLINTENKFQVLQSQGIELRGDVNLLRYSYLMDVGCRVSGYRDNGAFYLYPQVLFNVAFN